MSNSVRPHRRQPTRLLCPWDSPGKNTGVGCHCLLQCMRVKNESEVAQLCPTQLCLTPVWFSDSQNVNIHSCHLLFDYFQFALIHEPNIPGSYAILLFTALDFTSITSHIHNWVLFLLWVHRFILSGVISPLISSSILGTYRPGEFSFQYPIILPFHTVHGVLKARILEWVAIAFSSA